MARKSSSKTTAKKYSAVPPKAAAKTTEVVKPVVAAIPAAPIVAAAAPEKAVATAVAAPEVGSKTVVTAAKTETTPVTVKATSCCGGSTACESTLASTIESLHSDDADIARDAATKLGALKDRSAVEPLIAVVINADGFYHSVVRAAAAESLGTLGDSRAVESLLIALTDPIAEVSSEAIRALATLGDAEATDALIDVVRNRAGFFLPIARRAAVFGLVKLGGERAAETLQSIAGDEYECPSIRAAAHTGASKESEATAK